MGRYRDEVITIINELGLKIVREENRKHHPQMVLENFKGDRIVRIVPNTKASPRDLANTTAELKRFARGQLHGLKVLHDKGSTDPHT